MLNEKEFLKLNKEFCNSMSIAPKYKRPHANRCNSCQKYENYIDQQHNGEPCPCGNCFYMVEIFPDFRVAENFLKLEETMLKELAKERLTVIKWVHEYPYDSGLGLMYEYILVTKSGHKHIFKHNGQSINNWFVERELRAECLILFVLWKALQLCPNLKSEIKKQIWSFSK